MIGDSRAIRSLLRLYPAEWRAEYGEELVAVLEARLLTASTARDVIVSAIYEHLRKSNLWRASGFLLFLATALTIFGNNSVLTFIDFTHWNFRFETLILMLTGCWTVIRGDRTNPAWGAIQAGLLGFLPELARFYLSPSIRLADSWMHTRDYIPMVIGISCCLGFMGGMVGRSLLFVSPRVRRLAR
jgi:hypothetical protein